MYNTNRFNYSRNYRKALTSLRGITSGIVADDTINDVEILFLDAWLKQNKNISSQVEVALLACTVREALKKKTLTTTEHTELKNSLARQAKELNAYQEKTPEIINNILGFIQGITADNILNDQEIYELQQQIKLSSLDEWPVSILRTRLNSILKDQLITEEERTDLLELLSNFSTNFLQTGSTEATVTSISLHDDKVDFNGKSFCFTGTFASGSRKQCENATINQGATISKNVTKNLNYLVTGSIITKDWIHSSYGRKIEKAMEYQADPTCQLHIISEEDWLEAIYDPTSRLEHLKLLWKDRSQRSTTLLVSKISYSGSQGSLHTDEWAFPVPYAMREALDIQYDTRTKDKKAYQVWTQGPIISFKEGDIIFSGDKKTCIQVKFANRMGWDKDKDEMYQGSVTYDTYSVSNMGTMTPITSSTNTTQMQFLEYLIRG
ncbi:BRCT domain-containing protein [Aliamphritea hakodatensis]|uniref:BRCT domain-containing protein n=1 Tax=Aliamphritea hakodatensis TaxID=2895352 RepID=UPI0022FD9F95|nr:BRCT domain-containing protein [Aliamphritea hakodatensis]